MKTKAVLQSLVHAAAVFAYVCVVAWLMSNGEKIFGPGPDTIWIPIAMLMLFVLSAAITGALVLGRPILLYINGKKSEALRFFTYTVAWIFVITITVLAFQLR